MKILAAALLLWLLAAVPLTRLEQSVSRALAARCACGALDFAAADEFAVAANCQCSNCPAATAAALTWLLDEFARTAGGAGSRPARR